MKTMNVYFCGGAAVSMAGPFLNLPATPDTGFAKINVALVDTSDSDIATGVTDEHFYHVQAKGVDKKTDGSGKVRRANLAAIQAALPDVMRRFPPADMNVVVGSGSGGSGSVIAPTIMSYLLKQEVPAIAIMVGSSGCKAEVDNMANTIASYQSIAELRQVPVVCFYRENSRTTNMAEVDDDIRAMIWLLAATWSGQNASLDSADLKNFLQYHKVTDYPVGLVGLDAAFNGNSLTEPDGMAVSSMVTLVSDKSELHMGEPLAYHAFGVMPEEATIKGTLGTPIFLATVQGYFAPIVERFRTLSETIRDKQQSQAINQVRVQAADTDDGLIV